MFREGPIRRFLGQTLDHYDGTLEEMKEAKRREWTARGYPPELINKAIKLADNWTLSLSEAFASPEMREAAVKHNYKTGLRVADNWITTMYKQTVS